MMEKSKELSNTDNLSRFFKPDPILQESRETPAFFEFCFLF
jgi:hypothetical protein